MRRKTPRAHTFGPQVRARRIQVGMLQADLARAVGLSRSQVSNLEAGRSDPPLSTAVRIAKALDAPLPALLGEAPPVPEKEAHRLARVAARREHRGRALVHRAALLLAEATALLPDAQANGT